MHKRFKNYTFDSITKKFKFVEKRTKARKIVPRVLSICGEMINSCTVHWMNVIK